MLLALKNQGLPYQSKGTMTKKFNTFRPNYVSASHAEALEKLVSRNKDGYSNMWDAFSRCSPKIVCLESIRGTKAGWAFHLKLRSVNLIMIFIKPSFRGKGLGSLLLSEVVKDLDDRKRVLLTTVTKLGSAKANKFKEVYGIHTLDDYDDSGKMDLYFQLYLRTGNEEKMASVRKLILKYNIIPPCERCGYTDDVNFAPNPYDNDIHDDDTKVFLCSICHCDIASDI